MAKAKNISGTKEWAESNVNILKGCANGCLYCFGRSMARQYKRISSDAEWTTPILRPDIVKRQWRRAPGRVMFPSTHDITPEFLDPCVTVLRNLLKAGKRVLIVSKPQLFCIERLCQEFAEYKPQITFRFTIGAFDDRLFEIWEPRAPKFAERLACLKYAFGQGFNTGVSMEPMLDAPHAVELFHQLAPYVTDSIWLGKLNRVRSCVGEHTAEVEAAIERLEANQTDEKIKAIYETLQHEPLVRWKDSVKKVVGLPLAAKAGEDS